MPTYKTLTAYEKQVEDDYFVHTTFSFITPVTPFNGQVYRYLAPSTWTRDSKIGASQGDYC